MEVVKSNILAQVVAFPHNRCNCYAASA